MPSYDVLHNLINRVAPTIWQKPSSNRRRSTRTSFPKASPSIGCEEKTAGQLGRIIREHWRVQNLNPLETGRHRLERRRAPEKKSERGQEP